MCSLLHDYSVEIREYEIIGNPLNLTDINEFGLFNIGLIKCILAINNYSHNLLTLL